jgi:hypothetical protein
VKASIAEGSLQLRSFQNAARHAVAVAPGELPPVLAGDVGAESCVLRLQRVGLMLLRRSRCGCRTRHSGRVTPARAIESGHI